MSIYQTPRAPVDPERGHEQMDVPGRGFAIFAAAFVGGMGLITLLLIWILRTLVAGTPIEPASAVVHDARMIPPGPRLQGSIVHPDTPYQDRVLMDREHQYRLHTYGWVDRKAGIVHVPIDKAMERYASEGAPAAGLVPTSRPNPDLRRASPGTGGGS